MLEGYHFQNAYVTRDVDKWAAKFGEHAKVDKILWFEGTNKVTTVDGPGEQTHKIAFIWVGDLQYELIQPISGDVALYTDPLPDDDALKFHHICMRIDNWEEFRARVDQQPYPVVLEGGSGDMVRFLYLDTRELLGHYVEYVWMSDEMWTLTGGK